MRHDLDDYPGYPSWGRLRGLIYDNMPLSCISCKCRLAFDLPLSLTLPPLLNSVNRNLAWTTSLVFICHICTVCLHFNWESTDSNVMRFQIGKYKLYNFLFLGIALSLFCLYVVITLVNLAITTNCHTRISIAKLCFKISFLYGYDWWGTVIWSFNISTDFDDESLYFGTQVFTV